MSKNAAKTKSLQDLEANECRWPIGDPGTDFITISVDALVEMLASSATLINRVAPESALSHIHIHRFEDDIALRAASGENLPRPYVIVHMEQRSDMYVSPGCADVNSQLLVSISDKARFPDDYNASWRDFAGFVGGMLDDLKTLQGTGIYPPFVPAETVNTFDRVQAEERTDPYDFWYYSQRFTINAEAR